MKLGEQVCDDDEKRMCGKRKEYEYRTRVKELFWMRDPVMHVGTKESGKEKMSGGGGDHKESISIFSLSLSLSRHCLSPHFRIIFCRPPHQLINTLKGVIPGKYIQIGERESVSRCGQGNNTDISVDLRHIIDSCSPLPLPSRRVAACLFRTIESGESRKRRRRGRRMTSLSFPEKTRFKSPLQAERERERDEVTCNAGIISSVKKSFFFVAPGLPGLASLMISERRFPLRLFLSLSHNHFTCSIHDQAPPQPSDSLSLPSIECGRISVDRLSINFSSDSF